MRERGGKREKQREVKDEFQYCSEQVGRPWSLGHCAGLCRPCLQAGLGLCLREGKGRLFPVLTKALQSLVKGTENGRCEGKAGMRGGKHAFMGMWSRGASGHLQGVCWRAKGVHRTALSSGELFAVEPRLRLRVGCPLRG